MELGELGVLGIRVPRQFGGSEGSFVMAGIAAEELGRGDMVSTVFLQLALIAKEKGEIPDAPLGAPTT